MNALKLGQLPHFLQDSCYRGRKVVVGLGLAALDSLLRDAPPAAAIVSGHGVLPPPRSSDWNILWPARHDARCADRASFSPAHILSIFDRLLSGFHNSSCEAFRTAETAPGCEWTRGTDGRRFLKRSARIKRPSHGLLYLDFANCRGVRHAECSILQTAYVFNATSTWEATVGNS
jgi:hypothetical protein